MKIRIIAPVAFAALLCGAAPSASATTTRTRTEKSTDVSDNPQVKAAQKVRDDAQTALENAKLKSDKTAIDAAQKALDDAETKLKAARKAALKDSKSKNKPDSANG